MSLFTLFIIDRRAGGRGRTDEKNTPIFEFPAQLFCKDVCFDFCNFSSTNWRFCILVTHTLRFLCQKKIWHEFSSVKMEYNNNGSSDLFNLVHKTTLLHRVWLVGDGKKTAGGVGPVGRSVYVGSQIEDRNAKERDGSWRRCRRPAVFGGGGMEQNWLNCCSKWRAQKHTTSTRVYHQNRAVPKVPR